MTDLPSSSIARLKELCTFKEEVDLSELIKILRELRLLGASCDISCLDGGFSSHISNIITLLMKLLRTNSLEDELNTLCLHVGCQFISNLAAANADTCTYLWRSHNEELKELFLNGNTKVKNSISLLLINALNHCQQELLDNLLKDVSLFTAICKEGTEGSDFPQLFIEKLLALDDLQLLYHLSDKKCLSSLLSLVEDGVASELVNLSDKDILFFLDKFKFMTTNILNNSLEVSADEFEGIMGIVCSLSSCEKTLPLLQKDISLAIDCIYSLKAIHSCEKAGSAVANQGVEGYKRSLVRIIGNLCWDCKPVQDLVRENHCIPVILECCKIDPSNPFINEWAVFAIRNLCKDNVENQDVIAAIKPNADLTQFILGKVHPSVRKT